MDSMRHLSTSLPRGRSETSDILSDFRAAALSVTNLYKNAAQAHDRARAIGYQDALDDLLSLLDKENLGLMDGEGWRVRQWATARLEGDGSASRQGASNADSLPDDEDDNSPPKDDEKDEERTSSPEAVRRPQRPSSSTSELTEEDSRAHRRVVSEPPQPTPQHTAPTQGDFTFQSSYAYPTNHEKEGSGMDVDGGSTPRHPTMTNSSAPSSTETVRIVRPSRNSRHISKRNENRMPTLNFSLGPGGGNKRKMPYPDFFDISSLNDVGERKDGSGSGRGGKRGRHV